MKTTQLADEYFCSWRASKTRVSCYFVNVAFIIVRQKTRKRRMKTTWSPKTETARRRRSPLSLPLTPVFRRHMPWVSPAPHPHWTGVMGIAPLFREPVPLVRLTKKNRLFWLPSSPLDFCCCCCCCLCCLLPNDVLKLMLKLMSNVNDIRNTKGVLFIHWTRNTVPSKINMKYQNKHPP